VLKQCVVGWPVLFGGGQGDGIIFGK